MKDDRGKCSGGMYYGYLVCVDRNKNSEQNFYSGRDRKYFPHRKYEYRMGEGLFITMYNVASTSFTCELVMNSRFL